MIIKYKGVDNISKNSNKIPLDKYYTSPQLAKYIVDKTKEIIGEDNITEYIEPSAGAGVFLDYLDKPYLAYDIEPEDGRVTRQDYLELELDYKKGRCTIGNPPYGCINIHGHTHGRNEHLDKDKYMDVSVETINYKPIWIDIEG